jgi:hypothetical protein
VNEGGFGDTDIRLMTIPYISMKTKMGVATGVEFFLDTASEDALGAGATSVAPFVFVGFFNPWAPGASLCRDISTQSASMKPLDAMESIRYTMREDRMEGDHAVISFMGSF